MTRSSRLVATLSINAALVVGEIVGGVVAHSTGLLADAGHNLTDVAAVGLSLVAVRWAMRPRSDARSYGNQRATILAALTNAAFLAVVTVAIAALSVERLVHPVHVTGGIVIVVAGGALVANGVAALALTERSRDLNMRATRLHMVGDATASLAVLAAGVVVLVAGQWADRADPAASLVVAGIILIAAVRILRESASVLLESTPSDIDLAHLRGAVTGVTGVDEVHDLHVWSLSSDYRALSAHLVLSGHPTLEEAQAVVRRVRERVVRGFDIAHATLETECERCDDEAADPCGVDEHLHGARRLVTHPGRGATPSNRPA